MNYKYTAKIYLEEKKIAEEHSDDIDELEARMLRRGTEEKSGNIHGEIIDNQTQKVLRQFRKAPPD